jgi:hypothetical protein
MSDLRLLVFISEHPDRAIGWLAHCFEECRPLKLPVREADDSAASRSDRCEESRAGMLEVPSSDGRKTDRESPAPRLGLSESSNRRRVKDGEATNDCMRAQLAGGRFDRSEKLTGQAGCQIAPVVNPARIVASRRALNGNLIGAGRTRTRTMSGQWR